MSEGVVYVLTNEAMPGYTKIGKTTTSVEQRMKELDPVGIPLPFEFFYAAKVGDSEFVERRLHDAFDDRRVRNRREFFRIDPERVRSALELTAVEEVTPRTDVVETAEDKAALEKARTWRSPFNFKMVDIPVGATLTFARGHAITSTVADAEQIQFQGEVTSLSGAAVLAMRRLGYHWGTLAGL